LDIPPSLYEIWMIAATKYPLDGICLGWHAGVVIWEVE